MVYRKLKKEYFWVNFDFGTVCTVKWWWSPSSLSFSIISSRTHLLVVFSQISLFKAKWKCLFYSKMAGIVFSQIVQVYTSFIFSLYIGRYLSFYAHLCCENRCLFGHRLFLRGLTYPKVFQSQNLQYKLQYKFKITLTCVKFRKKIRQMK